MKRMMIQLFIVKNPTYLKFCQCSPLIVVFMVTHLQIIWFDSYSASVVAIEQFLVDFSKTVKLHNFCRIEYIVECDEVMSHWFLVAMIISSKMEDNPFQYVMYEGC